jgi:REP element-mobilizing transposase RayT
VKNKKYLIPSKKKEELHKYITGVIQENNCKMIAINSVPDHIHIFIGLHPSIRISDLVKDIKLSSNQLINNHGWTKEKFSWQGGFGVFSYSKSHIDKVYKYIMNQEEHHKKKTFREEYIEFLEKYEIKYDLNYAFDIDS